MIREKNSVNSNIFKRIVIFNYEILLFFIYEIFTFLSISKSQVVMVVVVVERGLLAFRFEKTYADEIIKRTFKKMLNFIHKIFASFIRFFIIFFESLSLVNNKKIQKVLNFIYFSVTTHIAIDHFIKLHNKIFLSFSKTFEIDSRRKLNKSIYFTFTFY